MDLRTGRGWTIGMLALVFSGASAFGQDGAGEPAQEPVPQPPAAQEGSAPADAGSDAPGNGDPTQLTPEMIEALGGNGAAPMPAAPQPRVDVPLLALKGRMFVEGRAPAVILAVEEELFVVREGSELTAGGGRRGRNAVVLTVEAVTDHEVRLAVKGTEEPVILQ